MPHIRKLQREVPLIIEAYTEHGRTLRELACFHSCSAGTIRNILIQRKEKIAGLDQNIETINRDAKEKDDAFASGIKEARSKGFKEKEALLQEGADEEREIIEKINQKAQADLAEMREKIAKDAEDVRTSLQKEIDAFANAIGEKILGRAV